MQKGHHISVMASLCFRRNAQSCPCIDEDCRHREHTYDERRHDPADQLVVSCVFTFHCQKERPLLAGQLRLRLSLAARTISHFNLRVL